MKCIRIHFRAGAMVLAGVLPLLAAGCSQSETPVPRPGMVASRAAPAFGKMLLEPAAMEGSAIRALDYAEEKGSAESAAGLQAAQDAGAAPASALDTLSASLPDRYLIKNARITLEVDDARKAAGQLAAAVQDAGGYVSDMQEAVDALGARQVTMQVRIPAERFGQALEAVEAAGRLLNKQISSQDVTEEYVDTESKLRNLKKTEERLLEHLSRTGMLEDIIAVERELTRVREEIERLEGRMRYLGHRVAFSTVAITLQEKPRTQPLLPPESFSTGRVASEATRALVSFGQGLWARVIWAGVWAGVWAPLAVLAWAVRRWIRRLRARRRAGLHREASASGTGPAPNG